MAVTTGFMAGLAGCSSDSEDDESGSGDPTPEESGDSTSGTDTDENSDSGDSTADDSDSSTGSSDREGPAEVVEQFFQADDSESANTLMHPDSPIGEYSEDQWKEIQRANPELKEILNVEIDDSRAVVEYEWANGRDSARQTYQGAIELRTHDGNWKIYDQDE